MASQEVRRHNVVGASGSGRPGWAGDGAWHRLFPELAEAFEVAVVEVGEEHVAHDPVVGDLRFAQASDPVVGEADEEAAPVVGVDAALEQAELGEAIDRSRDAAGLRLRRCPSSPIGSRCSGADTSVTRTP